MMAAEALNIEGFVPDELRIRKQWLVWKFEQQPGDKKARKVPYYPNSGRKRTGTQGSDEDRAQLVDYDAAVSQVALRGFDGVGFAFLPGDGLIGIDLDACIDTEDTERRDRAAAILKACNSFAEYSPSGNGMHIIVAGESETFKSNILGIEVFCGRQFFTFTGSHIPGTPRAVNPISAEVLAKLRNTVKNRTQERADAPPFPSKPADAGEIEDALAYISPDVGYDEWLRIGMAIHSSLGDGGISIWDGWSKGSSKYPGPAEIKSHWRSFKGRGVTIATLFKMAMDAGYKPPRMQRCEPLPPPPPIENIDYETGEILDAPPANDNDDPSAGHVLGPLTSWLLTEAENKLKILGRDSEDGLWLIREGRREPEHFTTARLMRRAVLLNLMSKKDHEDLIFKSGQGDRFTAENAASALMKAASENPVYRAVQPAKVMKQGESLTGVQGPDSATLAKKIGDQTIFDVPSQAWFRWDTVWRRINEEYVRNFIVAEADKYLGEEFENKYVNGTMALLKTRLARLNEVGASVGEDIWENDRNMLPMRNGVLNLETGTIVAHSPEFMFNWIIPHNYSPEAECPVTQNFIQRLAGGDGSTEAVLYCFLAAVLHGRYDLERYLEFVGMAGTGKSTYIALCKELVGGDNVHSTDMRTLHNNQFETANIYGKRLVMISDADKYGGDIGIFKSITGRDVVRREEKNRQAQSGFIYKGMVIIAANNPVQFADTSTAMARRRIPVHIDKKLDKTEVDYRLGDKLRQEIPGLINLLLGITQEQITAVLSDSDGHRRHAAMRALVETNTIAAWANECLVVDNTDFITPVGRLGSDPEAYMYPNFAQYCEQTGRKGVVSLNTFTRSLQDVLATASVTIHTRKKNTGMHISGVRLRRTGSMDDAVPHLLTSH